MRLSSLLLSLLVAFTFAPISPAVELPATSIKKPPMHPEQSVSTFVPSESAPGRGLAVNIIYPKKPRYKEGAPVVVVAPGGDGANGLDFSTHSAQQGFAEVRFAFPGGGKPGFMSDGIYDNRGLLSQQALRDVLTFAAGQSKDTEGRTISSLVPVPLANKTVGLIGWSNGGNIAVITLAKYAKALPFVSFLAFYESPLGAMFFPPSLGGSRDLFINRHYRQGSAATGSCILDYAKLTYLPTGQKSPGAHKKAGQPEIPGVVFFDENKNHEWDEESEFAFPYSCDVGLDKQIYPPLLTVALSHTGGFRKKFPKHVASLEESEAYFNERDGSLFIKEVAREMPNLYICVIGTQVDHLNRQPDHPHIPLNYNAWLGKTAFVRLNPDCVYAGTAAGMNRANFVNNKPGVAIEADQLMSMLEPKGFVPDYIFVEAAVAELSDRFRAKKVKGVLAEPIVVYSNGLDTTGGATGKGENVKTSSTAKPGTDAENTK